MGRLFESEFEGDNLDGQAIHCEQCRPLLQSERIQPGARADAPLRDDVPAQSAGGHPELARQFPDLPTSVPSEGFQRLIRKRQTGHTC